MTASAPAGARAARLAIALRTDIATAQLFAALGREGLEGLLLRGPVIAHHLYPAGGRTYADCDLLVPRRDRPRVEALLPSLGYTPDIRVTHARHWARASDGAEVDLHHSLWGVRSGTRGVWQAYARHASPIEVAGAVVAGLDEVATALVVGLHAAEHASGVAHPFEDLARALALWDERVWEGAFALATDTGSSFVFREGLTMLPAGRVMLEKLGIAPAMSTQAVLRLHGIDLPGYLEETLTFRGRIAYLCRRLTLSRKEVALLFDPEAGNSVGGLLRAQARRFAGFKWHVRAFPERRRETRHEREAFLRGAPDADDLARSGLPDG
jgi:hypothetical protein